MKKRSYAEQSKKSWENYQTNFSDLLDRSNSPKRKIRKHNTISGPEVLSQDITWTSSEDERQEENNNQSNKSSGLCLSPVLTSAVKPFHETCGTVLRSTPSGSPVLTQNKFSSIRKRFRKQSLLPLSPITPGCNEGISFTDISHLSIRSNNENSLVHTDIDSTPLALPLADSDDEGGGTNEVEITVITTQTSNSGTEEDLSVSISQPPTSQEASEDEDPSSSSMRFLPQTGSTWIKSLVEKIDEEEMTFVGQGQTAMLINDFDSAKKQKFIKGGLAEQLQQIVRHEKSQKISFQHQMKQTDFLQSETYQHRLMLKALSHHKEGMLHVLECKVCERGNKLATNHSFYTVLLQHEAAVENNINLTSNFTIFPPWRTINLEDHNFPILLCINHIQVNNDDRKTLNNKESHNVLDSEKSSTYSESLLEAMESSKSRYNISIAATIQRIYQQTNTINTKKWVILCEDAFGVFFEVELDIALTDLEAWRDVLQNGEGNRILFKSLFLKGRTTKSQSPRLFSLIESAWNYEGYGLMQVQSSQSQSNSCENDSQKSYLPPSFCYILQAKQGFAEVVSYCSEQNHVSLNRPNTERNNDVDVLYQHSKSIQSTLSCDVSRISICGKIISASKNSNMIPTLIMDVDLKVHPVFIQTTNKDAYDVGDSVLFKDVYRRTDGKLHLDHYSMAYTLDSKVGKNKENLSSNRSLFLWLNQQTITNLKSTTTDLKHVGKIETRTEIDSLVKFSGIVCKISHDRNMQSRDQCMSDFYKVTIKVNDEIDVSFQISNLSQLSITQEKRGTRSLLQRNVKNQFLYVNEKLQQEGKTIFSGYCVL